ncbi:hypothetical protein PIB30_033649 [Stylosanthes scabra]|uniref:Uncharacterized protein n=1 Tax=Stylosanthes scabra TaxID=79078 RepID=A0ABU6TCA6_9FABA|nr:hypothetical protein [Stylosanthes scabra]
MVAGAWPIVGHLPLLHASKPLHLTLGAMADKYGPLFTIKIGSKKVLVLSNSEMAKECFTKNDIVSSSRPNLVSSQHLGYKRALFALAPYGSYWRELRKIATLELLSNRRIELQSHVRVSEVEASTKELLNLWSTQKNEAGYVLLDLKQWISELIFNMVSRMIIGKRFFGAMDSENEKKAIEYLKSIREFLRLLGIFTLGDAIPSLRWLDLGGHEKAMKKTAMELDKFLTEWLNEHHQKKTTNEERDFIDVMISVLSDAKIHQFDADTITKATTLSMIAGATDTTTVTLTWAMCLLLNNPSKFDKAKEELDKEIGRDQCVQESDINKLRYLQAIVKETLRLYPPAPLAGPHEITENCNLGGYQIEKGIWLMMNIWKINSDPCFWPNQLEFDPDKFLTTHKEVDMKGQHYDLLPFGCGRRICPGISFGLGVVHFVLAHLLHSFEIINPSDEPIDMSGTLGIVHAKTTPLMVMVKPRLFSNCYETIM